MKPKNKYTIDELYNLGFRNLTPHGDGHDHYVFSNSNEGILFYMKKRGDKYLLGQRQEFPVNKEQSLLRMMYEYTKEESK